MRLEETVVGNKEKMSAQGITDLPSLLEKMKVSNILGVLTGTEAIRPYQRDYLIGITDPFATERDQLGRQVQQFKKEKVLLENQPLSTLKEFDKQRATVKHLTRKINDTQKQLDAMPERNTVPDDIYRWPSVAELEQKELAVDGKPYPELTKRGKEIIDLARELQDRSFSIYKRGGTVSADLVSGTWEHMRGVYLGH
jgi:hypothetical protein